MTDFAFSKFTRNPIAIGEDFFCAESGSSITDDRGFLLRSGYYADAASYPIAAQLEHCKISGIAATNAQSYVHLQSADNGSGTIVMTYSGASGSDVLVSTDNGATWANVSAGLGGGNATGVVWTGSRFIVAGNNGSNFYVRHSVNGTSWSGSAVVAHTSVTAGSVRLAYNGTVVYGVGSGSTASNASAFTTTDGSTLTGRTAASSSTLIGISGANGVFVHTINSSSFYTSTDGITFTSRSAPGTAELSAYVGGQWILKEKNSNTYYVTSNFTTFATRSIPGLASYTAASETLSFDASRVYVGLKSNFSNIGLPAVMWSSDLINWYVRGVTVAPPSYTVWHCHAGKYYFLKGAAAGTTILRSSSFTSSDYVGAAIMTSTPNSIANPAIIYRKLAD
jgi:hypothetical protein